MELLNALLRDKVHRDGLAATAAVSPTSAGGKDMGAAAGKKSRGAACWLCSRVTTLRYRLKDQSPVCFDCFRTMYVALVLPTIDTPERRASDARVLAEIDAMTKSGKHSSPVSSDGRSTVAGDPCGSNDHCDRDGEEDDHVFAPSRASFVMSASHMRQRLQGEGGGGGRLASPASPVSPRQYWNCPRCTYVNRLSALRCEACDFANSATVPCPHCGALCPLDPEAAAQQLHSNRCSNGKPHQTWCCGQCDRVNTLDGDVCEGCRKPRYWACTYCTAVHSVCRTTDGLRYCATCGSYNTPADVVKGQERIVAEQKKAAAAAAAAEGKHHHLHNGDHHNRDSNSGRHGETVFGVDDAQTLAEKARQSEIEANMERLNGRLSALHIRRIQQESDGNCLFAALAHQLFGNRQLHALVRSCVVEYMRRNPEDYSLLFDGTDEWEAYVSKMRSSGVWGDELCINAASRCFCVNVHVITSDPVRWHMVFEHDELGSSQSNLRQHLNRNNSKHNTIVNDESSSIRPSAVRWAGGVVPPPPPAADTLCLFLAYLAPVHFDDVTPTAVPQVEISKLLLPALHSMLKDEERALGGNNKNSSNRQPATSSSSPAAATAAGAGAPRSTVPTPTATPQQQRLGASSSGGYSRGSAATAPVKSSSSFASAAAGEAASSSSAGAYGHRSSGGGIVGGTGAAPPVPGAGPDEYTYDGHHGDQDPAEVIAPGGDKTRKFLNMFRLPLRKGSASSGGGKHAAAHEVTQLPPLQESQQRLPPPPTNPPRGATGGSRSPTTPHALIPHLQSREVGRRRGSNLSTGELGGGSRPAVPTGRGPMGDRSASSLSNSADSMAGYE